MYRGNTLELAPKSPQILDAVLNGGIARSYGNGEVKLFVSLFECVLILRIIKRYYV